MWKKGDLPEKLAKQETNEVNESLQSQKINWTIQDFGHANGLGYGLRDFRPKANNLR
jgi:hypothetical protein